MRCQKMIQFFGPAVAAVAMFFAVNAAAWADDYSRIDSHALNTPSSAEESIRSLAEYLIQPATNDREKARAIYRWVTANISYDTDAYFSGNHGSTEAGDVLKSRSSVCSGYSGLFSKLGLAAGLEVAEISGYAKGYGYKTGEEFTGKTDHAWNAVKLDGKWYLIDATWGAGTVGNNGKFSRKFEEFYFLTPPEQFIYRHFPEKKTWQLIDQPISKQEYTEIPNLPPAFFSHGFQLVSHPKAVIRTDAELEIILGAARDVSIMTKLMKNGKELENMTFTRRENDGYAISALFPDKGEYELKIFVKRHSSQGTYAMAMDYKIIAESGSGSDASFPKIDTGFYEAGFRPVSHNQAAIRIDSRAEIVVDTPDEYLMIATLKRGTSELKSATFVQRDKDAYRISLAPPTKGDYKLSLFSKRATEQGNYRWVMDYDVIAGDGSGDAGGFPETFEAFTKHNVRLFYPMNGRLKLTSTQNFKLYVPSAESVAIVADGQWTQLIKNGDIFEGAASIGTEDIMVFGKYPGNEKYSGLLKYHGYY